MKEKDKKTHEHNWISNKVSTLSSVVIKSCEECELLKTERNSRK